jgi:hypothetical protein
LLLGVAMGGVGNLSPSYSLIVGSVKDHILEILSLLILMFVLCRIKAELTVPNGVAGKGLRIVDKSKWKSVLISEFVSTFYKNIIKSHDIYI